MNAPYPPLRPETALAASWTDAGRADRLVSRLSAICLGLVLVLLAAGPGLPARLCAALVLLPLTGLLATKPLTEARRGRLSRWRPRRAADPGQHLARLARRPQGVIVPALGLCTIAILAQPDAAPGAHAIAFGGAAIVLGFPLLVAERITAAMPRAILPEAERLRTLLFVPALLLPAAGLLTIGTALQLPGMHAGVMLLKLYAGVVAAELAVRALANWFLPPPAPEAARAAIGSLAAALLQPWRLAPEGIAAPIRTHLGLDFSRSWALRYARSAALPIGFALGLVAWGLSGVSLIGLDRRGIYERFGKPQAVWAPGAHLGLPWPLGRVRLVDLGVVHAVLLGAETAPEPASPAEALAPASADRLWDQVHPSEVSYLLASRESDGRQAFQTISVDLKVLYRIGLDDAAALKAAYAVATPDELVRAEAGRLLARAFAGQAIEAALGAGREGTAELLRSQLQAELDRLGSGIELAGIVIEAIHPPPGAAEAYHNVQAAEIIADTAIATERGNALASNARARQQAADLTLGAAGTASETLADARVSARTFAADRDAVIAGGEAFLLERYFANLSTALGKSPLVIVDHRLVGPEAPSIDLRSFGAPPTRPAGDD